MIGKCEYCGKEKHLELREPDDAKLCDSCDATVNPPAKPERTFLTPDGQKLSREAYVKHLRECAARWRAQPVTQLGGNVNPVTADHERAHLEEQARKVEAMADRIARGED